MGPWQRRMSVGVRLPAGFQMIKERAVSISDKIMCSQSRDLFFARSLPSLVIDHSLLYYLSLIPFQTRSTLVLIPFPAFLDGFFLPANHRSLNVIQVILTRYFCLLRRFETSNLCACVRTGNA